jgi:RNA polymerase sigma factor (sigma-70 family)
MASNESGKTVLDLLVSPEVQEYIFSRLFAFARQKSISEADAEDLVGNAVLRAIEKSDQYTQREGSTFVSWLTKLAYNILIDEFRKRKKERIYVENIYISNKLELIYDLSRQESDIIENEQNKKSIKNREDLLKLLSEEDKTFFIIWVQQHSKLITRLEASFRLGINIDDYESSKKRVGRSIKKCMKILNLTTNDIFTREFSPKMAALGQRREDTE